MSSDAGESALSIKVANETAQALYESEGWRFDPLPFVYNLPAKG
jgi:hypothetical protein